MLKRQIILAALSITLAASIARADNYPMLEQLSNQTQSLYRDVQSGLVRVQLPTPKWIRDAAAKDDPLRKWDKVIDPQVKARIDQQRKDIAEKGVSKTLKPILVAPSTQPAGVNKVDKVDVGGAWRITRSESTSEIVLEPQSSAGSALVLHAGADGAPPNANLGGPLHLRAVAAGAFAPNNIGLLISPEGHVLVPLFVERETIGTAPIQCMVADQPTTATFVGSDEKTNLTILKLAKLVGKPIRVGLLGRPIDGALVMMLNPNSGSGRVQLWTGGERDFGVVVSMDGSVAGFARYGQFLAASTAKSVIEQLMDQGRVQRAILGVRLSELRAENPARQRLAQIADRPALIVDDVSPASPAEKAGLKMGDLILELEDQPVGDLVTWSALLAGRGEGKLLILRDGKPQSLNVNLKPAE